MLFRSSGVNDDHPPLLLEVLDLECAIPAPFRPLTKVLNIFVQCIPGLLVFHGVFQKSMENPGGRPRRESHCLNDDDEGWNMIMVDFKEENEVELHTRSIKISDYLLLQISDWGAALAANPLFEVSQGA